MFFLVISVIMWNFYLKIYCLNKYAEFIKKARFDAKFVNEKVTNP